MLKKHSVRFWSLTSVALIAMIGSAVLCTQGCKKKTQKPELKIKPVVKTNFNAVTSKLDPGGQFYMFADTTSLMEKVEKGIVELKQTITTAVREPDSKKQVNAVAELLLSCYKSSGVGQIGGLGASCVKTGPELYHNKVVLHKNVGVEAVLPFWQFMGTASHDLKLLKMLPKNTVAANFSDMDAELIGKWISGEIEKSNIPDAVKALKNVQTQFKMFTGMELSKFAAGYNGQAGMFITINDQKTSMIPVVSKMVKVPEFAIAIVIAVKDNSIRDLIKAKVSQMMPLKPSNENGIEMLSMDRLPMPFKLQPVVASGKGLLVIASAPDIVKDFFSDKAEKLVVDPEFKALSENMPLKGNGFCYAGKKFSETISSIQSEIMKASAGKQIPNIANKLYGNIVSFGVHMVDKDGYVFVSNSNMNLANAVIGNVTLAPMALMAGTMLPALNSSRKKARRISSTRNLKQIGIALKQYAMDQKDYFPKQDGAAGFEELRVEEYLTDPKAYVCSSTDDKPALKGMNLTEANVSYVYFGGGLKESTDTVNFPLVFDKPGNQSKTVNVLFGDGHVEILNIPYKTCTDIARHLSSRLSPKMKKILMEKAQKYDREHGLK